MRFGLGLRIAVITSLVDGWAVVLTGTASYLIIRGSLIAGIETAIGWAAEIQAARGGEIGCLAAGLRTGPLGYRTRSFAGRCRPAGFRAGLSVGIRARHGVFGRAAARPVSPHGGGDPPRRRRNASNAVGPDDPPAAATFTRAWYSGPNPRSSWEPCGSRQAAAGPGEAVIHDLSAHHLIDWSAVPSGQAFSSMSWRGPRRLPQALRRSRHGAGFPLRPCSTLFDLPRWRQRACPLPGRQPRSDGYFDLEPSH
jgi:hypothetical protein